MGCGRHHGVGNAGPVFTCHRAAAADLVLPIIGGSVFGVQFSVYPHLCVGGAVLQ